MQHQHHAFVSLETAEMVIARVTSAGYEKVDCAHLLTPPLARGAVTPTAGETSTAPFCGRIRRSRTAKPRVCLW